MADKEKNLSRRERMIWISELEPIVNGQMLEIVDAAIELASNNYRAIPGVRPGLVVEGLGTMGKTTTLQEIGKRYELQVRRQFGLELKDEAGLNMFLPVGYISLPGTVTNKSFDLECIKFFGVPVAKHATEPELTAAVERAANGCGMTLVLIDDIHFLKMKNRPSQDVNNHIKSLASGIPATFIYAGVDLDESGLFLEGRSIDRGAASQTTHRFSRHVLSPFELGSEEHREFLTKFEENLCLVNQVRGSILRHEKYIHGRTKGFKGATAQLMKLGARRAIRNGAECLSVSILEEIQLDDAAESGRRR